MTSEEREQLRRFLREHYAMRRGEARTYWLRPWKRAPEGLTDTMIDQFLDRYDTTKTRDFADHVRRWNLRRRTAVDYLLAMHGEPKAVVLNGERVGFDPITWFMICKLLIDLLLLWFRFQRSEDREA